ncbi:MAG: hypothetical protein H0T46_19030 [Deltaproteobacteria bacterium]|nr:hypothetical protein [Deltaproteobacteria bacterium]
MISPLTRRRDRELQAEFSDFDAKGRSKAILRFLSVVVGRFTAGRYTTMAGLGSELEHQRIEPRRRYILGRNVIEHRLFNPSSLQNAIHGTLAERAQSRAQPIWDRPSSNRLRHRCWTPLILEYWPPVHSANDKQRVALPLVQRHFPCVKKPTEISCIWGAGLVSTRCATDACNSTEQESAQRCS